MGACFKSNGKDAYNVCALVALNFDPEPMLAAAMICTAHPQSIDARPAMFSIVLQSVDKGQPMYQSAFQTFQNVQATIHDKKCLQFGDENMNVQKYNPPEVGAAEPSSANERAMHVRNTPHVVH